MQWNYQKIIYFLKVAETLNFSKAAKELFITPQALNKQILQLEKELGAPLFERSTRKVSLSPLGQKMQQSFLPAKNAFEKAALTMDQYMKHHARTLRIGFLQALSKREVVVPISNYLFSLEPNLNIELYGGELDDMIDWLYQKKCDLVLTNIHDFERWDNTTIVPLLHTPAKVAFSLYHPWMVKDKITTEDMAEQTILLYSRRKELEADSFYRTINAHSRDYAPNFNSMLAMLDLGKSYAVIPELFESMSLAGLRYLDLPAEYAFDFHMVAIYQPDSLFASLLEHLKELAEEVFFQL